MTTSRNIFIGVLLIALLGVGIFVLYQPPQDTLEENPQIDKAHAYSSDTFGISFEYPNSYHLEEKNLDTPQRERTIIILMEDTEENRLVREGKSPGREGPVTITVDLYQNMEDVDPLTWIQVTGGNNTNWKLDGRNLATTSLSGATAVSYSWSGLYEGRTVVAQHRNRIIAVSATYITPEDEILNVFTNVLSSFTLY